jgi:hypothetical protein
MMAKYLTLNESQTDVRFILRMYLVDSCYHLEIDKITSKKRLSQAKAFIKS